MHLRILRRPTETIASVSPEHLAVGGVYDIRSQVACIYLAKGWAEAVADDAPGDCPPAEEIENIKALVLVVEDEAHLRRLAEQLLIYRGYHVVAIRHGEEAIERLRDDCHGVKVLDLTNALGKGRKFRVEELYLTDRHVSAVPVLLRTDTDELGVSPASVGAIGVVRTPFDVDAVLEAIA